MLLRVVRIDRNVDNLVLLMPHQRKSTNARELAILQELALPFLLRIYAVDVVDVEQDGLDDPGWPSLEVVKVVNVLVTTASAIAGVDHIQKSIHETLADALAGEAGVNENIQLEGIAPQAGLIAVIIEVDIADDLFGHIAWSGLGLVALRNCYEVR